MQKLSNSLFVFLFLITTTVFGQKKELITGYIDTYKDIAINEMRRTGVPAAITLAQGIHESGAGNSKLALASNNHFGIKCKSNWTGETVKHDDDARGECFRKYPASEDSYKDHSDFLKSGQRYAFLFSLDPSDYQGWANGLKKAGYATNPKYPEVLIKLIEEYDLQQYTLIAMGKTPVSDPAQEILSSGSGSVLAPVTKEDNYDKVTEQKSQEAIYPSGQFKINETKVVFVKKGTSFLSIAKEYDIDLSKIFEFNEMPRTEIVNEDQLIYLQRKRKTGNNEFHVVQPGETMEDIARQEAIRLESLRELNWLRKDEKPANGERLSLQSKSSSIPKLVVKDNFSLVPSGKNPESN